MGPAKKGTRKRRSRKLTPEDRKLRRAEEMLRLAQVRVRRATTTMEYWQTKVQLLKAQKADRIQPSLFETDTRDVLHLLTEPEGRETNCRMKGSPFGAELFPGGSSSPPREGDDL